jgi:hypothetical protein
MAVGVYQTVGATPSKMTKINRFIAELNKHVKDERDVVMVSVKVR